MHHSNTGQVYGVIFLCPLEGSDVMPCHTGRAGFTDDFSELTSPVWVCGRNLGGLLTRVCAGIVCILGFWGSEGLPGLCTDGSARQPVEPACVIAHHFLMTTSNLSQSCLLAWPCGWHLYIFLSYPVKFFFFFFFPPMVGCSSFSFHSIFILNFVLQLIEMVCFKVKWIGLSLCSRFTFILHFFCDVYKPNEPRG